MAKKKRNREIGGKGGGICLSMATCNLPEKGSAQCAKRRCNRFKDPKNPKNRK